MKAKMKAQFIWGCLAILIVVLVLMIGATFAHAQTPQGPTTIPQLNTDFYVGSVAGFYPSIQNAVTLRCAAGGLGSRVIIPAGSPADGTSGYTISAVTGGCVKVSIEDRRAIPAGAYKWVTSVYVLQSSGGGTPPVVAGSSQYSNASQTAPISGGMFNSEAFNTANNGIATAQSMGLKNILLPATSTTTENIVTALTLNGSHLHDEQLGAILDYHYNSDAPISETKWCVDNHAAATPTTNVSNGCRHMLALFSESGIDHTGIPSFYSADIVDMSAFGNGIHQGRTLNMLCYTDDDCGLDYGYLHVRSANLAGASEGNVLLSRQGFEDFTKFGTVTTGGSGATTIQTSPANGGLANSANIIFPSENIANGTITGFTPGPGDRTLGFVTTTDTHSISSGYGFLTASCGTFTVANNPQPVTCPFTTGTFAGHTGFGSISAGLLVAVADWQDPECATATSVGGGNITFNLSKNHPSGTPIYQGTGTCAKAVQGRGFTSLFSQSDGFIPNYLVAGTRTTTTWDLIFPVKNAQNGQNPIPLYGPITSTITSAAQTGTTVTLTMTTAAAYFNHYAAPNAASICVSGNSNAAFNQCSITGIVASNGGSTLTYTVGSSATITGTGGIINVGTVALPASNGLGNYEIDCGALVTKIRGVDLSHGGGDGSVDIQANSCAMAPGEAFVQPNNPAQTFEGARYGWQAHTPNPGFGANSNIELYYDGPAFSGGNYFIVSSSDTISAFQGWGGNETPRTLFTMTDEGIGGVINMATAPIGAPTGGILGGSFASIGPFPAGGIETEYDLFRMSTTPGQMFLRVDAGGSLNLIGQGFSPALNIGGNVNGFVGGFTGLTSKYLHTNNLNSDPEPPLTLEEQFVAINFCRGEFFVQGGTTTSRICGSLDFTGAFNLQFDVSPALNRALTLTKDGGGLIHAVFPGDLRAAGASVLASTTAGDITVFSNSTGLLADTGIPSGTLASTAVANNFSALQTFQNFAAAAHVINGNGIQIVTGSGCTTAASLMASCNVTMTLAVVEPDTAYTVEGCTMSGTPAVLGNVSSLTTTNFVLAEYAATTAAATGGTITCLITHN